MKKFLFITHLSPRAIRSPLRQGLIEQMERSLHAQSYPHWKALWIGEEEYQSDRIKIVAVPDKQALSQVYLREDVKQYLHDCDYLVKLDDDDVILPHTLEIASKLDFDCYCDAWHTFYDVSSGVVTQEKRAWIASTCIHKKEHALMGHTTHEPAGNFINSLFYGEHGRDWIGYYKNKRMVHADRKTPVYVRVLSPTSITAGARVFPVKTFADIDMAPYYHYLKQFGAWNKAAIRGFDAATGPLRHTWEAFSGLKQRPIPGISFYRKLKDKVKALIA